MLYFPISHGLQKVGLIAPDIFENLPTSQCLQSSISKIPCRSLYVPFGHCKQLILYSSAYKPISQRTHSVLFSFETQPFGHIKHMLNEY